MNYRVRRTYVESPFRYFVLEGSLPVALTLTKWGAERLVRKLEKAALKELKLKELNK